MAIQATFTASIMRLFSEDFFGQALLAVFVLVTLFQMAFAGLALWFFGPTKRRNPKAQQDVSAFPGVSIIVCARNEASNLRQYLPLLLAQEYPGPWELLVVNDASTDDTRAVLVDIQQHNSRLRFLDIVEKWHPGKKQALAAGIADARFAHVLLTDADCWPASQHWLQRMAECFLDNPETEIVLGYGPMTSTPHGGFLEGWTRFEAVHTAMLYTTFAHAGMPYMGVGRNLALKKDLFFRVGGFHKHAHIPSGDDDLLVNSAAQQNNTAVCLSPDAFAYSKGKGAWKDWFMQKKRHLSASTAYQWKHKAALGSLAFTHTLHFFLIILLLWFGIAPKLVLILWLSRASMFFFLFRKTNGILREYRLLSHFPIYDALLAMHYGAFVPLILIGKKTHSWS